MCFEGRILFFQWVGKKLFEGVRVRWLCSGHYGFAFLCLYEDNAHCLYILVITLYASCWFPLPLGLFIILKNSTQLTAHSRGRVLMGSDK
jgi:hypothetical protein